MSAAWLRGILVYGEKVSDIPDITWAVDLQRDFINYDVPAHEYAYMAELQSPDGGDLAPYGSYLEALEYLFEDRDPDVGYFIIAQETENLKDSEYPAHAFAFKWEGDYAYAMMPNSGLFRCETFNDLHTRFKREHPFREWASPVVTVYDMYNGN